MLKKLDLLVIRIFVGPFFGTLFITSIILILQFFWKYLDDLAGKGLGVFVLTKLTFYLSATIIPLSLPIAVLFASLFAFGGMGERFELVAIKAAGISFIRFLRPVIFLALLITLIAFWFSNNIMPYSNMRFRQLLFEMIVQKPAFDLKPGIFFDKIDGYTIYVKNKTDEGKTLNDIVIFESQKGSNNEFSNIIIAKKGHLEIGEDAQHKSVLIFTLNDGIAYQEKGTWGNIDNEFLKTHFIEFKKILDMSSFKFMESNGGNKDHSTMNMKELDSILKLELKNPPFSFNDNNNYILSQIPIFKILNDSITSKVVDDSLLKIIKADSLIKSNKAEVLNKINYFEQYLSSSDEKQHNYSNNINKIKIEWHKKITLSLSCFIFFLIGSSLGAIIKKGGIGLPLIIAVSFFVFYFFSSTSLERLSKVGSISPFLGMWLSDLFLFPIGVFLSYKALNDSQLFNVQQYYISFKKIKNIFNFKRKITNE